MKNFESKQLCKIDDWKVKIKQKSDYETPLV